MTVYKKTDSSGPLLVPIRGEIVEAKERQLTANDGLKL